MKTGHVSMFAGIVAGKYWTEYTMSKHFNHISDAEKLIAEAIRDGWEAYHAPMEDGYIPMTPPTYARGFMDGIRWYAEHIYGKEITENQIH